MKAKQILFNIVFIIVQWTWGILQTLYGALVFLINIRNGKHFFFNGAIATLWNKNAGFSMGMFIFIPPKPRFYNAEKYDYSEEELRERLTVHEYGHSIQSMILGPFYVLMAIAACIWSFSPKYSELRKNNQVSYFDFFTEGWANSLGEAVTGKKSMERLDV